MTFLKKVALFTRAWIEIGTRTDDLTDTNVALFTRAWIEIRAMRITTSFHRVALFTRAWIEIPFIMSPFALMPSRPLYEGVD